MLCCMLQQRMSNVNAMYLTKLVIVLSVVYGKAAIQNDEREGYIFTFKSPSQRRDFERELSRNSETEIVREYTFGSFYGVLVKTSSPLLTAMRAGAAESVSSNAVYRGFESNATKQCFTHQTGRKYWALSLTSAAQDKTYYDLDQDATYSYPLAEDVDIYVLDTGVYVEHCAFAGRARHGVTAAALAAEGDGDRHGHGTHVAGTAAGLAFGAARNASIISVKVLSKDNTGSSATVLEGLEWIYTNLSSRRAVINISLGLRGADPAVETAIRTIIQDKDVPVVVAAGNSRDLACYFSPARMSEVITVGATDVFNRLAGYSNYGSCVDILAPGNAILSASPTYPFEAVLSGTSMAAPLVAGVVASFMARSENATFDDVRNMLLDRSKRGATDAGFYPGTPDLLLYSACEDGVETSEFFANDCINPPTPPGPTTTTPTTEWDTSSEQTPTLEDVTAPETFATSPREFLTSDVPTGTADGQDFCTENRGVCVGAPAAAVVTGSIVGIVVYWNKKSRHNATSGQ